MRKSNFIFPLSSQHSSDFSCIWGYFKDNNSLPPHILPLCKGLSGLKGSLLSHINAARKRGEWVSQTPPWASGGQNHWGGAPIAPKVSQRLSRGTEPSWWQQSLTYPCAFCYFLPSLLHFSTPSLGLSRKTSRVNHLQPMPRFGNCFVVFRNNKSHFLPWKRLQEGTR